MLIQTNPNEFEGLMENLSSKGLYLIMNASTEYEAREVVKKVEKLTHD